MKQLRVAGQVFGPFNQITAGADAYVLDGHAMFPFSVVGSDGVIEDYVPRMSASERAALAAQIDAAVVAIYDKPMRLAEEYKQREAQAQAYKDALYTGTLGPLVQGYADAAGLTPQQATDATLAQAAALRGALVELGTLRMAKNYVVRKGVADADAMANFSQAMARIQVLAKALA